MTDYQIRACNQADAATIAHHRVAMFRDMGEIPTEQLAQELLEKSAKALASALADETYIGWFAVSPGASRAA